jgi:HPt (histidine-containing phosphotransfer) domain-containing protein
MNSDFPHIDEALITELRDIMADDFGLLLSTFMNDSKATLVQIRQALEGSDLTAFSKACHSLKGSAGNIGVVRLAELCRQGEINAKPSNLEEVTGLLTAIEAEFSVVSDILQHQL